MFGKTSLSARTPTAILPSFSPNHPCHPLHSASSQLARQPRLHSLTLFYFSRRLFGFCAFRICFLVVENALQERPLVDLILCDRHTGRAIVGSRKQWEGICEHLKSQKNFELKVYDTFSHTEHVQHPLCDVILGQFSVLKSSIQENGKEFTRDFIRVTLLDESKERYASQEAALESPHARNIVKNLRRALLVYDRLRFIALQVLAAVH